MLRETLTQKKKKKTQEKQQKPHKRELASTGVDFAGKSDSRSPGTRERVTRQNKVEAERLKSDVEKRTSRICAPIYACVCAHRHICIQIKTHILYI